MTIKRYLSKSPLYVLAIYASILIFLVYTCAYAFRKPFTVGLYEGETLWGFDAKILYVLFEVIGYACSKFLGVKFLPGMKPNQRIWYTIGLMSFSEVSLLGFAVLPPYLKVFALFLSGLPLGMIWGVLISYLEGRRISEVLNVGLSVALIISSGLVKTLGRFVLNTFQVSEYWMPVLTGAICFPFMLLFAWLLNQMPAPSKEDIMQRTKREPMNKQERKDFMRSFGLGIALLMIFYGSLTVVRELRDSFAADIWNELHVDGAFVFTQTEIPIAFFVLLLMALIVFVRNNRKALNIIYSITILGGLLMIGSTLIIYRGLYPRHLLDDSFRSGHVYGIHPFQLSRGALDSIAQDYEYNGILTLSRRLVWLPRYHSRLPDQELQSLGGIVDHDGGTHLHRGRHHFHHHHHLDIQIFPQATQQHLRTTRKFITTKI